MASNANINSVEEVLDGAQALFEAREYANLRAFIWVSICNALHCVYAIKYTSFVCHADGE